MSRSNSSDTINTQVWKPQTTDQNPPAAPADREYKPQFLARRDFRRVPSAESYKSYSSIGSFTLDDFNNSKHSRRNTNSNAPSNQEEPPIELDDSPSTPRGARTPDSFTLEDTGATQLPNSTATADKRGEPIGPRRRSSAESFQTTGSFALDETTARKWEIANGWPWLQQIRPGQVQRGQSQQSTARNFSRPLRLAQTPQPQKEPLKTGLRNDKPFQPPQSVAPQTKKIDTLPSTKIATLAPQESSATSSSETTYRSSLASNSDSSSSSSASSIVLREGEYPAFSRNSQPQPSAKAKGKELERNEPVAAPPPSQTPKPIVAPPALVTRISYPPISNARPPQPNRKQVSFEHSRVPPPSLQESVPEETARPSTSSTITSRHSNESRATPPSTRSLTTIESRGSAGSDTSIATTALAEAWKASNHDISSLTPKELEKLKKKGIDPALWLEMRAATAKKPAEPDKEQKKSRKFKFGGRPLVGNAFIG